MSIRPVKGVVQSTPTLEGAGVKLRRAFGFGATEEFDPFLLLDDFRNERPDDYRAGFPWHPHRGIETVTYVLAGTVNTATVLGIAASQAGDAVDDGGQRYYAPKCRRATARAHAWVPPNNLPSHLKMTAPRYRDVPSTVEVIDDDGTRV
jgi:redox-sensitive bicupin YhaK (pirin superfamily)